jgi:hypothetical protein
MATMIVLRASAIPKIIWGGVDRRASGLSRYSDSTGRTTLPSGFRPNDGLYAISQA